LHISDFNFILAITFLGTFKILIFNQIR